LQQRKRRKQQQKEAGNKEIKVFVSTEDNVFCLRTLGDIAAITSHDNESHTKS
jgi:hypothetical protein